jgi:hypothetical protein
VRLDGYFAWAWRLFRATFWRLATVFVAGVAAAALLHFGIVVGMVEVLEVRQTVEALAVSFAAQVTLSTVAGTLLAAIAATVFVEQVAGRRAGADDGWRRLKPKLGHVVVAALYVAMPLLMLVLFLGQITQLLLLPAVLGPPVLVQAIVWERLDFRDAAARAKSLVSGHWGRVASGLLVLAIGPALVQLVTLAGIGEILPELDDAGLADSVWAVIAIAVTTAPVWLFTAAAGTVAYLDLRARFEELDGAGLEAEAAAPAPAS